MTTPDLAAMRAAAEQAQAVADKATAKHPGPWEWDELFEDNNAMRLFDGSEFRRQILKAPRKSKEVACYWPTPEVAALIADASTTVPTLAGHVLTLAAAYEQALAELDELQARVTTVSATCVELVKANADVAMVNADLVDTLTTLRATLRALADGGAA